MPRLFLQPLPFFGLLLTAACSAPNIADNVDLGSGTDLADVVVCDGQTLAELERAKTLSASCKAEVAAYLPSSSDDFRGRVVVLGSQQDQDGPLRVFVAGTDAAGAALADGAYGAATVSLAGQAGLDVGEQLKVTPFAQLTTDVLSLELVNDYSASMSAADLTVVEHIQSDLVSALPSIYEGELTLFSSEVLVKQAFTTDRAKLLGAIAYDQGFDRELTALYDGMGNGLDSLCGRSRPARVLMVSTDGLENASVAYKKAELVRTIAADHVFVVMLGALFADVGELKSLAGPRGAYFYTPLYADLRPQVAGLVQALAHGAAIEIPPALAAQRPLRLDIGEQSVVID
jgi:hypothetical protein